MLVATALGAAALAASGSVSASADDQASRRRRDRRLQRADDGSGRRVVGSTRHDADRPGGVRRGEPGLGVLRRVRHRARPGRSRRGRDRPSRRRPLLTAGRRRHRRGRRQRGRRRRRPRRRRPRLRRRARDRDEVATCLEEAFGALLEAETASADEGSGATLPDVSRQRSRSRPSPTSVSATRAPTSGSHRLHLRGHATYTSNARPLRRRVGSLARGRHGRRQRRSRRPTSIRSPSSRPSSTRCRRSVGHRGSAGGIHPGRGQLRHRVDEHDDLPAAATNHGIRSASSRSPKASVTVTTRPPMNAPIGIMPQAKNR